ncbi:hypothetical protein LEP1GSC020_0728 [Leptospira interrogans serovar Grippotyphosa str. 2006006986]|uniref:Uncharacterized protein n=2 Tax=Leptospira TaxID=171 RepID=A0A0E2AY68_9LEPT|nr:hypothetical protein LEP1GSC007_0753 [Leptospira interrogans serovar Bulgarica str. Mallika]EKO13444.1 hypothetical protein LEP1GSC081_2218 [Leptospira kirschneri str. H1]EKP84939.1 hypothetical protein LEP1GSC020_0728 [Leptospira interrogans serovar Grippotyphosa str. 2006006986]EMM97535.1 hypothetical protein LEP1GSC158_3010 [Leptospira interrogans serovar Zanoni str. LT2156]
MSQIGSTVLDNSKAGDSENNGRLIPKKSIKTILFAMRFFIKFPNDSFFRSFIGEVFLGLRFFEFLVVG